MADVADGLYGKMDMSAPKRNVLSELWKEGPKTVPQMAGARPVSRQRIQVLVDALIAQGLVESIENPNHARSNLIRITNGGKKMLEKILDLESKELDRTTGILSSAEIENAGMVLNKFRLALNPVNHDLEGDAK